MTAAFFSSDVDRNGSLGHYEVFTALQQAGFQCSQSTVQSICAKYDNGRGVELLSFLQVAGHLATIRTIFEFNDQQNSGKIALSFDQLAHITTHLLEKN